MFSTPRERMIYETARTMHDILSKEGSGRGMAYRRGWNGQPYDKTWASYPVYRAGKQNRKEAGPDAKDLPPVT